MRRDVDRAVRRRVVGGAAYAGRSLRGHQDARAERRAGQVRLVCRPCRRRIKVLTADGVDLAYRPDERRSVFGADDAMVLVDTKTWRCSRCGRGYPVTLERMRTEYAAALTRGDRTIELPI